MSMAGSSGPLALRRPVTTPTASTTGRPSVAMSRSIRYSPRARAGDVSFSA